MKPNVTPLQKRAFKLLELSLLWEGRFNKNYWINQLHISSSTATTLLNSYKELCPEYLNYDKNNKAFFASQHFTTHFSSGQLEEYLTLCANELPHIEQLGSSYTAPAPEHTRPIIHAITHQQRLDIRYASIKNPDGEERIISPHSLINNGQRWHVRAWCEKSEGYRDFVLSRIRQVFNLEGQAQMSAEQDEQWNAWINFSIEPDPRFNEAQKALIALDYGMSKNSQGKYQKHYQVRKALVLYWVQHLRIDRYREAPEAQQIILSPESNQIVKDCLPR